jgi:hypothetical protein
MIQTCSIGHLLGILCLAPQCAGPWAAGDNTSLGLVPTSFRSAQILQRDVMLDPKNVYNRLSEDGRGRLGKVPCRMVRVQSGSLKTFAHLTLLTRLDLESLGCLPDDGHDGQVAERWRGQRSRSMGDFRVQESPSVTLTL